MMLPAVEIDATAAHRATVVWLHGLGASGHDFEPIVPHLRMPWARFVFPHAPELPVTINGGWVMPAWYDIKSLAGGPGAAGREDEAQIRASGAAIAALLDREAMRVPASRIVLAGFSQGGAMALHTGHRYPHRLAGIACLSGYLVLPGALAEETTPENADAPLFFGHGSHDDVVPLAAGEAAAAAMAREVTFRRYPMAHEVCGEEILDIARWLHARLATPT